MTEWDFGKSVNDRKPVLTDKDPLQISNMPQK